LKTVPKDVLQKLEILADAAKPHSHDEAKRPIVTTPPRCLIRNGAAAGLRSPIGTRENDCASLDHWLSSIHGASRASCALLHVVCADKPGVRGATLQRGAATPCIPRVA
jgi:hypothetical protein